MENKSEWRDLIGMSASLWTILQMFSPMPSCYNFIKKQSVGDMLVTPYVVAFTSCTLWFLYGYIFDEIAVVKVNLVGLGLQIIYILCYYIYCTKKAQVKKQVALGLFTITAAFLYSIWETDSKRLALIFGLICSCVTILFFASPSANVYFVIKTWNSESLPRLLIVASFIVSSQWCVYGYIINDSCILITNLLGSILSGLQLCLIMVVPRDPKPKYTIHNSMEF